MKVRVQVITTIEDHQGNRVWAIKETATRNNGDNPRFLGADAQSAIDEVSMNVRTTMEHRFGKPSE